MSSSKPTILILGGGWHVPESYAKLTNALKSQGYEVHVPLYTSMSESRPPTGNLVTDTFQIREIVQKLASEGREIIALLHSYGGHVGTNALDELGTEARAKLGLPGGVSHLVFLCAYALTESRPMYSMVQHMGDAHLMPLAFDYDLDNSCVHRMPELMVGDYDESEKAAYLKTLKRWNGTCMYEPVQRCAWRNIPSTFIITTDDMTLPMRYQQTIVEGMQKELKEKEVGWSVKTIELKSGHCANLTATANLVAIVEELATSKA